MTRDDIDAALFLAASLCRRFEGFRSRPYLCPAGVATIGYGSTFYENGVHVTLSDPPITESRAGDILAHCLRRKFLPDVLALCPELETPGQLATLLDFAYNLGAGNLRASTLRRRVNARAWLDVPGQLRRWNKAGGRVLPGLVRRREAEAALWLASLSAPAQRAA